MRRGLCLRKLAPFLLGLILFHSAARAEDAASLLARAISHFERADLIVSLRLLERARQLTSSPDLLGRIHLYQGFAHAVLGAGKEARAALRIALTYDAGLRLDPQLFKRELLDLLEQVRRTMSGELRVKARRSGLLVTVDGSAPSPVPFRRKLSIGRHRVEVRTLNGKLVEQRTVMVQTSSSVEVTVKADEEPARLEPAGPRSGPPPLLGRRRIWTWVALGSAAGLGGIALGLYVSAAGLRVAEMRPREDAAYALWGLAGGAAVASIALFFLEGRRPARTAAAIVPLLGPSTGLSLAGGF